MSTSQSVLSALITALPTVQQQMYFKASLTALSHAMEDQVLAETTQDNPLIIAAFQRERFYRLEARRYQRIATKSNQVYVLSAAETEFKNGSSYHETITFDLDDALAQEWHLVVIGSYYASCLICREKQTVNEADNNRRFEGVWTFDRHIAQTAAKILLDRILTYRPELADKVATATAQWLAPTTPAIVQQESPSSDNPEPFVQRLITYLQASQYKLIKANNHLQTK